MRKDHSELICIIDKSGSMQPIANDSIGGFNSFLESQKELPGTASVTLALFDQNYQLVHDNVDIKTVRKLDNKSYVPGGSTALLDAIGKTMNSVGARIASSPESEHPENVIVCILTDGEENSSLEFTNSKIKEMIEHQQDVYKWKFIFLGANQDAFATAHTMGISSQFTSNFCPTSNGVHEAYSIINQKACYIRRPDFKPEILLNKEDDGEDEFRVIGKMKPPFLRTILQ